MKTSAFPKKALTNGLVTLLLVLLYEFYFYEFLDYFTNNGFDDSVVFHFQMGLDGIRKTHIFRFSIVFILISFLSFYLIKKIVNFIADKYKPYLVFIVLFLCIFNPLTQDIYETFTREKNLVGTVDKYYVDPEIKKEKKTKNLIYIYLESMERTFLDQQKFHGLTPYLSGLKDNSIDFTNIKQSWGTNWTIAGMVATQCGTPLPTLGRSQNNLDRFDGFLKGINCLGDDLRENGYFLSYLGGASLEFAGKGSFYKTHGFHEIQGKDEVIKSANAPEYRFNEWGLYDEDLYPLAIQKIKELENKKGPYAFFMLSVDTHMPFKDLSRKCDNLKNNHESSDPIIKAIACADLLAGELIEEIKKTVDLNNTVIVVASDHLAMGKNISDFATEEERRNLLLVLNDEKKEKINKEGYSYDVTPTLLTLMNFDVDAYGFGRSLLKDEKDLPATVSNKKLRDSEKELLKFWKN